MNPLFYYPYPFSYRIPSWRIPEKPWDKYCLCRSCTLGGDYQQVTNMSNSLHLHMPACVSVLITIPAFFGPWIALCVEPQFSAKSVSLPAAAASAMKVYYHLAHQQMLQSCKKLRAYWSGNYSFLVNWSLPQTSKTYMPQMKFLKQMLTSCQQTFCYAYLLTSDTSALGN